jgi:hypothetical protein
MKGTPDNTIILHWDECRMVWAKLSWRDWVRFRGYGMAAVLRRLGRDVKGGRAGRTISAGSNLRNFRNFCMDGGGDGFLRPEKK